MHKKYEDRGCALHSANYSHSSLQFPSRNASRRKRIWSTQEGSNFLLFASKISPAAEKSRSTAVDVAGAVRYLKKSFNANVRTIYCGYQGWTTHPAPQNTRRFWPLPCPAPAPKILTLAPPHPAPKEKKSGPSIPGGYQEKPKLYLFANDTRATPAGPFATKEGSIFSHQARHSTSCSSENRTLSTKSSTDLVLFIPASTLNYRAFQILFDKMIFHITCLLLSLSSFSQLLPGLRIFSIIRTCWWLPIDRFVIFRLFLGKFLNCGKSAGVKFLINIMSADIEHKPLHSRVNIHLRNITSSWGKARQFQVALSWMLCLLLTSLQAHALAQQKIFIYVADFV